jgi:5'-3' exonuclease
MKTFIVVDTSYAIFYRYHATKRWYSFAHREDYNSIDNYFLDEVFKSKFKKLFVDMFTPLFKKYKSDFHHVIFAKDCPRKNIWRNDYIQKYKGTRTTKEKDKCIGDFFKYTYQSILPELEQKYSTKMIECATLEGDDCIYIIKDILSHHYSDQPIIIIASDHDLMQLLDNYQNNPPKETQEDSQQCAQQQGRIQIINLKGKSLHEKSCGDSRKDLEIKIITGDKSDNIPGCFPKCGYKTALKLVNNKELLEQKFMKHEGSREIYERNKKIISFAGIPKDLYKKCYETYDEMLSTY